MLAVIPCQWIPATWHSIIFSSSFGKLVINAWFSYCIGAWFYCLIATPSQLFTWIWKLHSYIHRSLTIGTPYPNLNRVMRILSSFMPKFTDPQRCNPSSCSPCLTCHWNWFPSNFRHIIIILRTRTISCSYPICNILGRWTWLASCTTHKTKSI